MLSATSLALARSGVRGLMRTQWPVGPANSIIKLFDAGNAPENGPLSVTHWDFAFLKALYSSSNQLEASQQRGEMTAKMAEELARLAAQGK